MKIDKNAIKILIRFISSYWKVGLICVLVLELVVLINAAHADTQRPPLQLPTSAAVSSESSVFTQQFLTQLDQHLANHPRDVQAKFERATLLVQQGQTHKAIGAFQALIQQYPELPEPYNNLAVIYANQGQYEKARTLLETAIHVNPGYSLAYQNLGSLYLRLAAVAYQHAVSLNAHDKFSIQRQQQIQTIIFESS